MPCLVECSTTEVCGRDLEGRILEREHVGESVLYPRVELDLVHRRHDPGHFKQTIQIFDGKVGHLRHYCQSRSPTWT
jgi:hypothetical protein